MDVVLTAVDQDLAEAWTRFCGDLPNVRVHLGSILEVECDAVVSPSNSFGFLDGGIDAIYLRHFGPDLQDRLQQVIAQRHHGELVVGTADIIDTGDTRIPFLIAAPTMRVPMRLIDSVNPYLAARAALLLLKRGESDAARAIRRLAFPGLGTGVGGVSSNTCARQVRAAIEEALIGRREPPRTWAEASERHQELYTYRPRRLQH